MKSENEGISRTHSQFYQYKQLFHLITISTVIFTSDNKACVNFLFLNIPESSRRFLYILKIEMEIQLRERNVFIWCDRMGEKLRRPRSQYKTMSMFFPHHLAINFTNAIHLRLFLNLQFTY